MFIAEYYSQWTNRIITCGDISCGDVVPEISPLTSLSAVTIEDVIVRNRKKPLSTDQHLRYSKLMAVA